jgi:hypothetical protein
LYRFLLQNQRCGLVKVPSNIALQPTPRRGGKIGPILAAVSGKAHSQPMGGGAAERRRWAVTSNPCDGTPTPDSAP